MLFINQQGKILLFLPHNSIVMTFLELFLIAIGLSMDAFSVSICKGLTTKKFSWPMALICGLWFGGFQVLMPIIGYYLGAQFQEMIEAYDHWIAFAMLAFIGIRMIREAFMPEEERFFNPRKLRTQILLAIATSIDALAVGISFVCTGYHTLRSLTLPLWIIGIVSFVFAIIGNLLGISFGKIGKRFKPELIGGFILIGIGCKILYTHLA